MLAAIDTSEKRRPLLWLETVGLRIVERVGQVTIKHTLISDILCWTICCGYYC